MPEYVRRIRALIGSGEVVELPSVSVAIRNAGGRVLLARHVEGNRRLPPGGGVEPGETPADAAVREAREETGLIVHLTRLVGVVGGPDYVVHYRNGDRASYGNSVFEAAINGGTVQPDGTELRELRFALRQKRARSPQRPGFLRSWRRSSAERAATFARRIGAASSAALCVGRLRGPSI